MKFVLFALLIPVLFFLIIVLFYLIIAISLRYIPYRRKNINDSGGNMKIYISSNGAHTDTILPIDHLWMKNVDWFDRSDFEIRKEDQFVGVGWGDRGFYLDIPEWKDLTPMVAIKALFLRAPTLMHLTVQSEPDIQSKRVRSFYITKEQFEQLDAYIYSWFDLKNNSIQLVEGGYTPQDQFYAAKGNYSMVLTCNEWTNRGLKRMKHRSVFWAPFAGSILEQLPKSR